MFRSLQATWVCVLPLVTTAQAATLYLANEEGGGTLTIPELGTGIMQVRVDTSPVDSIDLAFVNAFFDVSADNLCIAEIDGVPQGDCLAVEEYEVGGPAAPLPPGDATYILASLTLLNQFGDSGETEISFEGGARSPQAFGPGPDFSPFVLAPDGFPPGFPNFLYVGDPFVVTKVPEPSTAGLLVLGLVLAAVRNRPIR